MDVNILQNWTPFLLSATACAPMLWIASRRTAFQGVAHWVAGNLAMCGAGAAHALASLQERGLSTSTVIGGLLLLAYYYFYAGCRALRGQKVRSWLLLACLLWLPLDLWLSTQAGRPDLASGLRRMAYVLLLSASITTLLSRRPAFFGMADRMLATFMGFLAGYHLLRAFPLLLPELWSWTQQVPLAGPQTQAHMIVVSGFTAIGFAACQLLILHEHSAWELKQAANDRLALVGAQQFKTLFEHAPVALVMLDHHSILTTNQAFRQMFDASYLSKTTLQPFLRTLIPDPTERRRARHLVIQQLRPGGRSEDENGSHKVKINCGPMRRLHVLLAARRLNNGLLISLHNITPMHELQERLHESEQRYRYAMTASRDGIWDWNCRDDTVDYSMAYFEMLGLSSEPIGRDGGIAKFIEMLHPEDRTPTAAFIRNCIEHDDSYEIEFRMRHRQGHFVWILGRGKVVERDISGHATRVVGTHTDISGRKALELNLKSTLEQQRTLLMTVPLGICEVRSASLVRCNAHMHTLFAIFPNIRQDCSLFELIPEEELLALEARTKEESAANRLISTERTFVSRDGEVRHFRIHGQSITSDSLRQDGVLVAEDVTEQHRITDDLIRARDAADSAARAAQGLLANVRHQVNTPLNAILGFAELLTLEGPDPSPQVAAAHIHQAATQLQQMLEQLQSTASAYAQRLVADEQIIDLREMFSRCVTPYKSKASALGIDIQMHLKLPAHMVCAPTQLLEQAASCLLDNAIRHPGASTIQVRIELAAHSRTPLLRFEVQDNGTGVPPALQPALFKPFIAGDFSDTRQSSGIGLGLNMVRRIANTLGGEAYFRPLEPSGSLFGFTAEIRCTQQKQVRMPDEPTTWSQRSTPSP